MSTDVTSGAATATSSAVSPTTRDAWQRARFPVTILLLFVVFTLLIAWFNRGSTVGTLDPDGVNDTGSKAVAQLLEREGVDVVRVDRLDDARSALDAADDATLFVAVPDLVRPDAVETLRGSAATTVLVSPVVIEPWVDGVTTAGSVEVSSREPDCDLRAAELAGDADMGGRLYDADEGAQAVTCYPSGGDPSLVVVQDGSSATVVIGAPDIFTNDRLDDRGNAALAMNLLGEHETLVWFLPSPADLPEEGESLTSLLPDWLWFVLAQLAVAVVVAALWRGRRLGPVVEEPLPVVVRASEATEGRGRLLQKTRARDRAAARLREATLSRLVPRLGLGPRAEPTAVVDAVASLTDRSTSEVGALLYGAAPADDVALVRLADGLDALEREVRRP